VFYPNLLKLRRIEYSNKFPNLAEKYLKEALKEMGVGAKTAVGYGYFS
jgi:CRISPR/Cas system CMR subunit Cmr6 (Cas7 group RAMP superfamily)